MALGWQPFDEETYLRFKTHPRLIVVYPHTSSLDLWLCFGYMLDRTDLGYRCRILMADKNMHGIQGWILARMGMIGAASRDKDRGGSMTSIIRQLRDIPEFILPASPKGDIKMRSWRSGYYHMAKELDCHLAVGGLDYHQKRYILHDPFKIGNMTQQQVEDKCKNQLRDITPMNIRHSEFDIDMNVVPLPTSLISDYNAATMTGILVVLLLIVVFLMVRNQETKKNV